MDLSKADILIFSGEGDNGEWERYHGARTVRALRSKLSRERCHGDRWASVWIEESSLEDKGFPGVPVYLELNTSLDETTGKMRTVEPSKIVDNPAAMIRAGKKNPASAENGKKGGRPRKTKA